MNIDMIEVMENNKSFLILPKKETVVINNKRYPIKEEKIYEFIRIIRNWRNEYNDTGYYDGNRFEIRIYYDGKMDLISGVRGIPKNYDEFIKFVRDIYDGR